MRFRGAAGWSVAGLIVVLSLASCASVSVEPGQERQTERMPSLIYVADFSTKGADFQVDRTGKELQDFQDNLQLMLKKGMVADITDKLVPAVEWKKSDKHRLHNAWLVRGEFVRVNQGSRLLRATVGFGAGGTKLETRVQVYDLDSNSDTPFMTFSTTGGSGAEPGAIIGLTTDPLQLAIGAASGVAHGLSEDTARTARMVTAQLSDYMYHHHWIPEDKWIKPKRPQGDIW